MPTFFFFQNYKRVNDVNHFRNYVTPFKAGWLTFVSVNYLINIKPLIIKAMGRLLYIIAVILIIAWAIGLLGYNTNGIIHVLLIIAVVAIIIKLFQVSFAK